MISVIVIVALLLIEAALIGFTWAFMLNPAKFVACLMVFALSALISFSTVRLMYDRFKSGHGDRGEN